jgi:hypothetical protein
MNSGPLACESVSLSLIHTTYSSALPWPVPHLFHDPGVGTPNDERKPNESEGDAAKEPSESIALGRVVAALDERVDLTSVDCGVVASVRGHALVEIVCAAAESDVYSDGESISEDNENDDHPESRTPASTWTWADPVSVCRGRVGGFDVRSIESSSRPDGGGVLDLPRLVRWQWCSRVGRQWRRACVSKFRSLDLNHGVRLNICRPTGRVTCRIRCSHIFERSLISLSSWEVVSWDRIECKFDGSTQVSIVLLYSVRIIENHIYQGAVMLQSR